MESKECIRCKTPGPQICTKCILKKRSYGEKLITDFLTSKQIKFVPEATFTNYNRRFDFYLPDLNTIIEFDGQQHFFWYPKFHRKESDFLEYQKIDVEKTLMALKSGIKVIRLDYLLTDNEIEEELTKGIECKCNLYLTDPELYAYMNIPETIVQTGPPKKLNIQACNVVLKYWSEIQLNYFWYGSKLTVYIPGSVTLKNSALRNVLGEFGFKWGHKEKIWYNAYIGSKMMKWLLCTIKGEEYFETLLAIIKNNIGPPVPPTN